MFLRHGDGKYIDLLERILYNGVLSGVSLAGNTFFYQNPLESNGRAKRTEYFEVACCPANLARLLEQVPGLVYAQTDDPSRGHDLREPLCRQSCERDAGERARSRSPKTRATRGTATSR